MRFSKLAVFAGACAFIGSSGAALAAPVKRNYVLTSTSFSNFANDPAPFAALVITFSLFYDDTEFGSFAPVTSFQALTDGQTNTSVFGAPAYFRQVAAYEPLNLPARLVVQGEGTISNNGILSDFGFSFDAGGLGPRGALLSFIVPGKLPYAGAAVVTISEATSPVPEPTAWAMLIGGFGITGAVHRHRPRKLKFAC